MATVVRTGMPRAASSPRTSTRMPRASASSCMFRTRTVGHLELAELEGEQQGAAEVLGVGDLDDDRALLAAHGPDEVPGHLLVLAQGQERVEAGRVDDLGSVPARRPAVDLDGRAGVVRDGGPQAGERVEERALADVGVAEEDDLPGAPADPAGPPPLPPRRPTAAVAMPSSLHPETEFQLQCQV